MGPFRSSFIVIVLIKFLLDVNPSGALYEDQIKKFDWALQNVGEVISAQFDTSDYNTRIFVATKDNVLAALCPRTGKILWRKVFEKGPRGSIKFFYLENEAASSAVTRMAHPKGIITVTGHAPAIVRGWSASTGYVQWEWSTMPIQQQRAEHAKWFFLDAYLYHVIPVWGSHLEVTKYFATTGQTSGVTGKITAPWIKSDSCVLTSSNFACLDSNQLIWINLSDETPQIQRKSLEYTPKLSLQAVQGRTGAVQIDENIITLSNQPLSCSIETNTNVLFTTQRDEPNFILNTLSGNKLQIVAINANTCENVKDIHTKILVNENSGKYTLQAIDCKMKRSNKLTCSYVFSTTDGSIILANDEDIRWTREESLSRIQMVEFIDLPLSDAEGAIETELNTKPEDHLENWDIIESFVRRITSQLIQVKNIFFVVMGLMSPQSTRQKAGLVRDAFGLHKMIVAVTENGKLFGIDNINGKIHWKNYIPSIENFVNNEKMRLIVQRTSKHFPNHPVCTLIGRDKETGQGMLYSFNPITGRPMLQGLVKLNYRIKQIALLKERESDFLRPIVLMDADNVIRVLPEDAKNLANGLYMFTANKQLGALEGFFIQANTKDVIAKPIWKIKLNNQGSPQSIIKIAGKNPSEHVHSQGRVLSDRSVLYKYINPNLVAVVTQSLDSIHKYILNVYLVDAVSGAIVYSMSHRKAREPIHIVHSENWLVYSYYNDKVRRTEITTLELYEGKVQTNSTTWSSLDALSVPFIEKQSYILPSTVDSMRETITERGITNKHILIGITNGAIVEMPWALLDPRRPVLNGNQVREEGAIPYIPELPLPTENIINYNQSIERIENIYTAPSGLESTCLVIAYGLDIFVTRVAPSKTFDLLKEDFDYFLITVVLIALTTGSFVAKHLSARKALKQAWK